MRVAESRGLRQRQVRERHGSARRRCRRRLHPARRCCAPVSPRSLPVRAVVCARVACAVGFRVADRSGSAAAADPAGRRVCSAGSRSVALTALATQSCESLSEHCRALAEHRRADAKRRRGWMTNPRHATKLSQRASRSRSIRHDRTSTQPEIMYPASYCALPNLQPPCSSSSSSNHDVRDP